VQSAAAEFLREHSLTLFLLVLKQPHRSTYFPAAFFAAAAFFALNLAHRFLVASAIRFRTVALSLRFLG
jgi:hypothetical protein